MTDKKPRQCENDDGIMDCSASTQIVRLDLFLQHLTTNAENIGRFSGIAMVLAHRTSAKYSRSNVSRAYLSEGASVGTCRRTAF
jgi:hypothetical protein